MASDVKDNIMQRILKQHEYERIYKDGEKYHMPVGLYKKTMEERDAIIENAKDEADEITETTSEELDKIVVKKENLIRGTDNTEKLDVPYDEWSIEDLRLERAFYLEGTPGETDIDEMSLPQLRVEHNEIIAKYNKIIDGYEQKDGKRMMGYNELVRWHNSFLKEPSKLLETEEGKKVLEDAKYENTVEENK